MPGTYTFDPRTRQFRSSASPKFVPRAEVRAAVDAVAQAASDALAESARALQAGTIDLQAFEAALRKFAKLSVVSCGAVAAGGRDQLTPSLLGMLGARVKAQYGYARAFVRDIESGVVPIDSDFAARAAMYGLAGVGAFEAVQRKGFEASGVTEEKRVLGSGESCRQCIAHAAKGWQPVGTLPGIGDECACRTRCHCSFRYRGGGLAAMSESPAAPATFTAPPVLFAAKAAGGKGGAPAGHWVTHQGKHLFIAGPGGGGGGAGGASPAHADAAKPASKPGDKLPDHADRSKSIGDPPPRSSRDKARDTFSAAKADHGQARAAHAAKPSKATASKLADARAALGKTRDSYRSEHEGGKIAGRPLDSHDPRIRAHRESRSSGLQPGRETDPTRPRREQLEDRVLLRTPSALPVEHHYGQKPAKIAKDDAPAVKAAAKRYEANKPLSPAEEAHAARYADLKASDASGHGRDKPGEYGAGRSYLTFDRRTGEYGASHTDYALSLSPLRHESFRSGRLELLKAYGPDGREIKVTKALTDHLRGGEHAMRETNVARHRAAVGAGKPKATFSGPAVVFSATTPARRPSVVSVLASIFAPARRD